jgi:citrate lyase beta subunit
MTESHSPPPRRAVLVVPGGSARMLEKAVALDADELVFDLEDAVAPAAKVAARAAVAAALPAPHRARRLSVRVNAVGSPWLAGDLQVLVAADRSPDTIVVPKVESASDLRRVADALEGSGIRLQALIESARGLRDLGEICAATPMLEALILGYADLCASLDRPRAAIADFTAWGYAQDCVVMQARAAGLQAVDGPLLALDDDERLTAAATWARGRGFDGKWVIHPKHVDAVTDAFTPSSDELAAARALLHELEEAERSGAGAARHGGMMIDEALRKSALGTIARAAS